MLFGIINEKNMNLDKYITSDLLFVFKTNHVQRFTLLS